MQVKEIIIPNALPDPRRVALELARKLGCEVWDIMFPVFRDGKLEYVGSDFLKNVIANPK
jgi:hypothetical protein